MCVYTRLQRELEECKDCPEERTYHSLHGELEELQRFCYHKQMRQHTSRRNTRPEGRNLSTRGDPTGARSVLSRRDGKLQSICPSV